MYHHHCDDTMVSRNGHYVLNIDAFDYDTPRLLAWGSIMALPDSEILKTVCHIADVLPPEPLEQYPDYYSIIDCIKDSIGYVYENNPTPVPRPIFVEDDFTAQALNFEEDVITAARYLKKILGPHVTFCQFVAIISPNAFLMEIDYEEYNPTQVQPTS